MEVVGGLGGTVVGWCSVAPVARRAASPTINEAGHPGRGVSGDLAQHLVRARAEHAEVEHLRFALLEILRRLSGDGQVVGAGRRRW